MSYSILEIKVWIITSHEDETGEKVESNTQAHRPFWATAGENIVVLTGTVNIIKKIRILKQTQGYRKCNADIEWVAISTEDVWRDIFIGMESNC